MQARQFDLFLQRLSSLTRRQRTRVLALLQHTAGLDLLFPWVRSRAASLKSSPVPCGSAASSLPLTLQFT